MEEQNEITIDLHSDVAAPYTMHLVVRSADTNAPVADAKVDGAVVNTISNPVWPPHGTSDANGNLEGDRPDGDFYLHATTPDQKSAVVLLVHPKDADPPALEMKPTATFTGRLVDTNGRPLAKYGIRFGIHVGLGTNHSCSASEETRLAKGMGRFTWRESLRVGSIRCRSLRTQSMKPAPKALSISLPRI